MDIFQRLIVVYLFCDIFDGRLDQREHGRHGFIQIGEADYRKSKEAGVVNKMLDKNSNDKYILPENPDTNSNRNKNIRSARARILKGLGEDMDEGRRKVRVCLVTIVLAAVVIGSAYYWYSSGEQFPDSEGTLIRQQEEM